MADRSQEAQELHDRAVLSEARELDRNGWDVKVDHPGDHGWEEPPVLNGRQPDVYATKQDRDEGRNRDLERAVELETSASDDKDQRKDLQEWASQEKPRDFYWRIVDENGSRGKRRG